MKIQWGSRPPDADAHGHTPPLPPSADSTHGDRVNYLEIFSLQAKILNYRLIQGRN